MLNLQSSLKAQPQKPLKMHKAKTLLLALAALLFLISCQSKPEADSEFDNTINLSNKHSQVILLHGMFRDAGAMQVVETFLSGHGDQVTNISYPSTEYDIETLVAEHLAPVVEKISKGTSKKFTL